jgi:hypothetical protein
METNISGLIVAISLFILGCTDNIGSFIKEAIANIEIGSVILNATREGSNRTKNISIKIMTASEYSGESESHLQSARQHNRVLANHSMAKYILSELTGKSNIELSKNEFTGPFEESMFTPVQTTEKAFPSQNKLVGIFEWKLEN